MISGEQKALNDRRKKENGQKSFGFDPAKLIFGTVSLLSLFLILKNSELAIDYMERGMKLCVSTVIPSLFPFMVASELIVFSGAAGYFGKLFHRVSKRLFGIGGEGASAFLLGIICGFPVGTRAAVSLYRKKRITHGELSRLVCFSNNPSSAFVISAIGGTLFGCRAFGVVLYCITIATSLMIGIILRIFYGDANDENGEYIAGDSLPETDKKGISFFSGAVSSAASAMLGVCAFIIFFSVFTGLFGSVLDAFGAPQGIKAWLFSLFELTGGVAAAAGVKPITLAAVIAAFAVGWSGISVHFQVASFCDEIKIKYGRYFTSKLLQGVLNALFIYIYLKLFGNSITFNAESVAAFDFIAVEEGDLNVFISSSFFATLFMVLFSWVKRLKKQIK